jgi:predicted  nucleic acid-binding Zn-ribbon protein
MGKTRKLYQLQSIELNIESKEKLLAKSLANLGENKVLTEARDALFSTQQNFGELKKKQQDAEWEVEDVINKLTSAQESLYSGRITNPKELSSLQQEVEGFKRKRDKLEEEALAIMEQIEIIINELAGLEQKVGEVEKKWHQEQQQLKNSIEELKNSISNLEAERQKILVSIDNETFNYYTKLKQKKGQAVARVEQGICRGCSISLSTAELQRVKGDRIIMCTSCGRILFID